MSGAEGPFNVTFQHQGLEVLLALCYQEIQYQCLPRITGFLCFVFPQRKVFPQSSVAAHLQHLDLGVEEILRGTNIL